MWREFYDYIFLADCWLEGAIEVVILCLAVAADRASELTEIYRKSAIDDMRHDKNIET